MQTGATVMSKPLWVPMDAEERKGHVDSLLRHLERVDELEGQKRAAVKKFKRQIDEEMLEVQRLRRVLRDDGEQMTLADAKVDNDPTLTKAEATETLAAVAEGVVEEAAAPAEPTVPQFHKNGSECTKPSCKRRHLTASQLEEIGIKPGETGATICAGCDSDLTEASATERLKGLCEGCQTAAPGNALEGTPESAVADHEGTGSAAAAAEGEPVALDMRGDETTATPLEDGAGINGDPADEDDPRARCSTCDAVLRADEVVKRLGMCEACIAVAGGDDAHEEHVGGEA